jgi:carbon starvation protein
MNAVTLVFAALCFFAIGYRFYGLFLANKVLGLDPQRITPALKMADGHDYVKTNRYVLFGHHFAAIAAAGPLLGPVLAAQFGFLPGALWIIIGCVLGGAVHDTVVLFASVRHKGQSLSKIAENEIGATTGTVASFAIMFILIMTLAGLSIAVVNAMFSSPWGTLTVLSTIPIALIMGLFIRRDKVKAASIVGVALLGLAVSCGPWVVAHPALASLFTFSRKQLCVIIPVYGFAASVLPVWLLLAPRDYLSTFLKIGTIVLLAAGIFFLQPHFQMPALTQYIHGGGPIIPGHVFPFVFITIACGALSGFHSIIGSGTTPKMIGNEKDILFVGYGSMLVEGFVAVMALVAACVLIPADYFAINTLPEVYQKLGMTPVQLGALSQSVQEQVQGRPGGAVSLAVGMAYIFSAIPAMKGFMAYWYHFAIMFEAVFILTAVDAGTRVGRFFLQEMLGKVIPKFSEVKWVPGILLTSFFFTFAWGYLIYGGDISTIWPLFGMSNQLLAASALIIGTVLIIRLGRAKYAWVTFVPGLFMSFVTMVAGYENVVFNYLPKGKYLLTVLSIVIMILMLMVLIGAFRKCFELLQVKTRVEDKYGQNVLALVEE